MSAPAFTADRFTVTATTHDGTPVAWTSASLTYDERQRLVVEGGPYTGGIEIRSATLDGVSVVIALTMPGSSSRVAAGRTAYATREDYDTARRWEYSCEAYDEQTARLVKGFGP